MMIATEPTTTDVDWLHDPVRERAHRAAVEQERASRPALWRSCFACSVVVGRYEFGATAALAKDMGATVDTVENRARAARLYIDLFHHFRRQALISEAHRNLNEAARYRALMVRLRYLRQSLAFSFFVVMAKELAQERITPSEIVDELGTAEQEGISVKAMAAGLRGSANSALRLPVWTMESKTAKEYFKRHPDARVVLLPADWECEQVKVKPA